MKITNILKRLLIVPFVLFYTYTFSQYSNVYRLSTQNIGGNFSDTIYGIGYGDISEIDTVYFTISSGNPDFITFLDSINSKGYNEEQLHYELSVYDTSITDWIIFTTDTIFSCNNISTNISNDPGTPTYYSLGFAKDDNTITKIVRLMPPPVATPYLYLDSCITKSGENVGIYNLESFDIKIYPNPVQDILHIDFNHSFQKNVAILSKINGEILEYIEVVPGMVIDMDTYQAGIYLIRIGKYIFRIVKT